MVERGGHIAAVLRDLAELPDIDDLVDPHPRAADPGREVVDLPDALAFDPECERLPRVSRAVPRLSITATLDRAAARVAGGRYVWADWLADVLRDADLSVVEHPGWKRRGRPFTVGPFTPRGLCWHHDASARGPSPELARFLAEIGRPADGIPAPLSQTWVCMGCRGAHPVGTWHVLAAGRANHAGEGDGWRDVAPDAGNTVLIGTETDNTTGEPTPPAMLASLVVGSAAILRRLRSDPRAWLCAHREYAPGRKSDPDDIAMSKARRLVVRTMRDQADGRKHRRPRDGGPRTASLVDWPGRHHFQPDRTCSHGAVQQLTAWLGGARPTRVYTRDVRQQVRAFQQQHRELADELAAHPGVPGPETWWLAQIVARDRVPP